MAHKKTLLPCDSLWGQIFGFILVVPRETVLSNYSGEEPTPFSHHHKEGKEGSLTRDPTTGIRVHI